jgi:hypothetical protein
MAKYIIGVIALILIIAGGYYFLYGMGTSAPASVPTANILQAAATSTYATSTYSVTYPADYTADPSYAYTQFSGKPINGVKFTIPMSMATGTNLASDTYLSIEQLPHAKNCTGDIYIPADVAAQTVSDNGVTYSLASTTGAGAGNLYEETVYALSGSSPCTAVRYYIHSSNIGNYDPGTVREFDRSALLSAFDTIRRSLSITTQQ